ncbi:MAG: hypothetical protein WBM29_04085 [Candidatus Deferrimicrobium sp.]
MIPGSGVLMKGRSIAFLITAVGAVSLLLCGIFRKEIAEVLINGALL